MDRLFCWCVSADSKTRLTSFAILLLSILMSIIVFVLLNSFQLELIRTYSCFSRDFSIILSYYATFLIQNAGMIELKDFIEQLYLSTSGIQYLRLFDQAGNLLFSFPFNSPQLQQVSSLNQIDTLIHSVHNCFLNIPILSNLIYSRLVVVDSVLPLGQGNTMRGFLQLGLSLDSGILYSLKIAQLFSVMIFVFTWLMFALGAAFNFFIISEPTKRISIGLQDIASGNFGCQLNYPASGSIGDLIVGFNEMSRRLLLYEKKNIMQLMTEKIRLEALVSTIADGAILLDTELRFLFINQVAVKVFHWSNKDLIGEMIFQHLPVHVSEALLPILNTMIRSSCLDNKILQTQKVSIDLYHGSFKSFRFLLSTILSYKNRGLNGVVITIQDVTREAQLNGAKNQFISNVSHELRTPLCNIRSFLETLIDYECKLTSDQKSNFLSIAYAETQRLNGLVNDVLDLSRLDSGYHYSLYPVGIKNTILYIVKASQIVALNKKVNLAIEACAQAKKVLAHESSLCQILSNLISNALKFTHVDGKIVVRLYPLISFYNSTTASVSIKLLRLEVIDEGIGIEKAYQRQIFDRFMRIENNIHMLEGTGLGLSIVKNIAEKHNSAINFYSEVGIGTSFWLDLCITD